MAGNSPWLTVFLPQTSHPGTNLSHDGRGWRHSFPRVKSPSHPARVVQPHGLNRTITSITRAKPESPEPAIAGPRSPASSALANTPRGRERPAHGGSLAIPVPFPAPASRLRGRETQPDISVVFIFSSQTPGNRCLDRSYTKERSHPGGGQPAPTGTVPVLCPVDITERSVSARSSSMRVTVLTWGSLWVTGRSLWDQTGLRRYSNLYLSRQKTF